MIHTIKKLRHTHLYYDKKVVNIIKIKLVTSLTSKMIQVTFQLHYILIIINYKIIAHNLTGNLFKEIK